MDGAQAQPQRLEASERSDPAARRAQALRAAAGSRHADALARAEAGLRRLIKDGAEVNFRAVARAGSVGINFLYDEPGLRHRIEGLRAAQQGAARAPGPAPEPDESHGNMIRALSAQLKAERSRNAEHVRDLELRLAAAHGEILALHRQLGSARPAQNGAPATPPATT